MDGISLLINIMVAKRFSYYLYIELNASYIFIFFDIRMQVT